MSDEKTLKKIEKERKSILIWLKNAEKDTKKLKEADSERKKEKYTKILKRDKLYIELSVENVLKYGGNIDGILEQLTPGQMEIWQELYAQSNADTVGIEVEIQRIKKLLYEDLKEAMEKDDYNPDDPIEVKMKSRRFVKEAFVGSHLNKAGLKTTSTGKVNEKYNDYWNYERDWEATKDKYFTSEEQKLIEKCLESRAEEKAYLVEKRAWMGDIAESLYQATEKMDAWGDITQARIWARNIKDKAFPKVVEEIYGKLPKKEVEQKSREMARRYISFIGDQESIEKGMEFDADAKRDAAILRKQLSGVEPVTSGLLIGRTNQDLQSLRKAADEVVDGQNMLEYFLLRQSVGIEQALFIALYKADPLREDRVELLTAFSFEELGL